MSNASDVAHRGPPPATSAAARQRDIRLDFFRGIGMFIIFVAHTPYNGLQNFIPARFGFSDATEIFVFCSGMASAIAFGSAFNRGGFQMGLSRVAYRVWQVYWAHISIFMLVTAAMVIADRWLDTGGAYSTGLNVTNFLSGDTGANLIGLLTLTYVPNLFDVLPMYLVILMMIPIVMALSRLGRWYVAAFVLASWLGATFGFLDLPAEPWTDRVWFFNPFGWQLVFFAGFAFMMGWVPAPPIERRLVIAAAVFLIVTIPIATEWMHTQIAVFGQIREALGATIGKTNLGIFRFVHFLCLAYLAYAWAGPNGDRIRTLHQPTVKICTKVGQQALGVYLTGQMMAMLCGIFMDQLGHTFVLTTIANAIGFAALIAAAYIAGYFKSAPWSVKKPLLQDAQPASAGSSGSGGGSSSAKSGGARRQGLEIAKPAE